MLPSILRCIVWFVRDVWYIDLSLVMEKGREGQDREGQGREWKRMEGQGWAPFLTFIALKSTSLYLLITTQIYAVR